ncbi:methyltransferase domain-containing protein [Reyranella sp.]|uniref:class I SAM-dependent methyltransferase n=1 Tax=Reyranella sp. TaxID=1929291 RepID=UPI001208439E|nr:methyltransferase domain-containing protein [Reyranella sp.]TAJ87544.1 MAG: methyltransferase domain-containing protein [Reyranella sp.]
MAVRLNIGCGQSPTEGWFNYDNSPAVWLARSRLLTALLGRTRLLDEHSIAFAEFCRGHDVRYANAAARIPHETGSVDAIYSSHMMEHLDRSEARAFLAECLRVLRPGGVLRLAVPDLRNNVRLYLEDNDADAFVDYLLFDLDKPRGLRQRLNRLVTGGRGHHWIYDRQSLTKLVEKAGFADVQVAGGTSTRISDPGALVLDERDGDTICVEALRP